LASLVKSSDTIRVTEASGRTTKGTLGKLSTSSLELLNPKSIPAAFSKSEVRMIELERRDSLWNGTLIGLGAGGLSGLIGGAANCGNDSCQAGPIAAAFGALFGGIGAGVGALVDLGFPKRTTIYQQVALSFEDLHEVLKTGETVVVTDDAGQKTQGKVAEVTGSSLEVLLASGKRTFAERAITEIRTADRLGNGVAKGLGLGVGLGYLGALGVAFATDSGGVVVLTWLGASVGGALIGAKIDASIVRGPVVYASRRSTQGARLRLAPLLSKSGQGVLVSVGF
jgi:hypothetical protein